MLLKFMPRTIAISKEIQYVKDIYFLFLKDYQNFICSFFVLVKAASEKPAYFSFSMLEIIITTPLILLEPAVLQI